MLLHIPAVQRSVASKVSEALSEELNTKVELGTINLGLLNRIIIDNVLIEDQQHRKMLQCHRVSTKIDIIPLLSGRISISSAQLFGLRGCLVKENADTPLNCQFVIDALSSKDTTSHTPLNLEISSLVIRNTSISYDRLDKPHTYNIIDPNHISLEKVSSHIMLYTLTDDSISVRLKTLSFIEKNSGFNLNKLTFDLNAGKKRAELSDFNLITKHSDISINCFADYDSKRVNKFQIESKHSSVSTRDVTCFIPLPETFNHTFFVDLNATGSSNTLNLSNLTVNTYNKDVEVSANGQIKSSVNLTEAFNNLDLLTWNVAIPRISASSTFLTSLQSVIGPDVLLLKNIGDVTYTATANGAKGNAEFHGKLATSVGNIEHSITKAGQLVNANVSTSVLQLGRLLSTSTIGDTELKANIVANLQAADRKNISIGNVKALFNLPLLTVMDYPYHNITLNTEKQGNSMMLKTSVNDLNLNTEAELTADNADKLLQGKPNELSNIMLRLNLPHIIPHALGLSKEWQGASFGLSAKAAVKSLVNPLAELTAEINDFSMTAPEKSYYCNLLALQIVSDSHNEKTITLNSDFADADVYGNFEPSSLVQSLKNLVASKLPTLPGISQYKATDNRILVSAKLKDAEVLEKLFNIDIHTKKPITLNAFIDDRQRHTEITLDAPQLNCFGMDFKDASFVMHNPNDTLNINTAVTRINSDGTLFSVRLDGAAANNTVTTTATWNNGNDNSFTGSLKANSQLFIDKDGATTANVNILPSDVMIANNTWHLHPSQVVYKPNYLSVSNFLVENGSQHIGIDGLATKNANDSLTVNLHDINVAYIMNIVDFHSVEFSGRASGIAVGKALFAEPQAYTQLKVNEFLFESGRLGVLNANGKWNNELGQIDIDAYCDDKNVIPIKSELTDFASVADSTLMHDRDGFVKIDGYISIKRNFIDLDIKATNARLEFLQNYTGSFMNNINAWASGRVRINGPLSAINMTGEATANGSIYIIPLNTYYTLNNDYVRMIPDEIIFNDDPIYDKFGNKGMVNGALHHRNLGKMTFDLNIDANHLLCFNFPELDGSTFCGYVVGSGNCKITGRPGVVNFDIDAYPEKSSYLTYNASSPDALQNQEFITWREKANEHAEADSIAQQEYDADSANISSSIQTAHHINENNKGDDDFHTNIHLNFLVHATPECMLRVIMDQRTGDYIALHGNGTLQATYYNKGGMQIFGNYAVDHGEYKMTIQKVITKSFDFMPGGNIAFAGNPFDAVIDLQARYVVPSAPLSDLNIGNTFSNSTVRVNCLMNISGTAEHPVIDFDLNLPQASTDIQQMITSIMDSEEARNQQVVYLLSIGRFYSANNNATFDTRTQASLAMQSFLSGTVSQQLNNLISDVIIKNNNWNFGANISPGDEGMMNAEYEGLVSGRMLNNRLLINGQFGYRDNVNATTSFIGDFDVRYLLFPNGNLQVRVYNQTSDRYFTKANLNTQGLGVILKYDFNSFIPYFLRKRTYKQYTGK